MTDASAKRLAPFEQIERLAGDLHALAFDMREPSRSTERAERIISEAERIASDVRAVVRGRG